MTVNKRFTIDNESDIIEFDYNNNEYIQDFIWADGKSWDKLCNRLNELYDENEQLKQKNYDFVDVSIRYQDKIAKIENENEELQQFKEQVFQLINEKILECEEAVEDIRYNGKDSYIVKHDVASKILKELKKELSE